MSRRYQVDPRASSLTVTARAALHRLEATGPCFAGEVVGDAADLELSAVELTVDLSRLRCTDRLRQHELRRYLKAAGGGPLRVAEAALEPGPDGGVQAVVTALWRGHRPRYRVALERRDEGEAVLLTGGFTVRLAEVGLAPPRLLLLKVREEVEIALRLCLTPAPDPEAPGRGGAARGPGPGA